jgi:hypothetical protein
MASLSLHLWRVRKARSDVNHTERCAGTSWKLWAWWVCSVAARDYDRRGFIQECRTCLPVLESLSFTVIPKTERDPIQQRRAKFISNLRSRRCSNDAPNRFRATAVRVSGPL